MRTGKAVWYFIRIPTMKYPRHIFDIQCFFSVCPCSCINLLEQAWNVGSQMFIDSTVVGGTQCT